MRAWSSPARGTEWAAGISEGRERNLLQARLEDREPTQQEQLLSLPLTCRGTSAVCRCLLCCLVFSMWEVTCVCYRGVAHCQSFNKFASKAWLRLDFCDTTSLSLVL